ncbi:MAG: hypothetical protein VXW00_05460, partial [Candidatus Latescibacterota bacterium]|nr:hypothetical protein [Candidatus Latescibacterota bacterium]
MDNVSIETGEITSYIEARYQEEVNELKERVNDLTGPVHGKVENLALAQEMANAIKPHIDRLVKLNALLTPVTRILEKRSQLHDVTVTIEEDIEEAETALAALEDADKLLLDDFQENIETVKKDRKLYVQSGISEEEPTRNNPNSLELLPVEERFHRVFSERFISLDKTQSILSTSFENIELKKYTDNLEAFWNLLFRQKSFRQLVEKGQVAPLAEAFQDYVVLFRSSKIINGQSTTISSLQDSFPDFFIKGQRSGVWYKQQPFYNKTFRRPHWALVDKQYLNCTFKKPSVRLRMYARANGLSAKSVRQKNVLEDIYDRITTEIILMERFFENCNSITRTVYKDQAEGPAKQVFLYYKDHSIRISG